MEKVDEKILERIRRLLAYTKSDNVHEAAEAMKKAQELLFKYNLEYNDIPQNQKAGYVREKYVVGEGRVTAWARELLFPIARYNFGKALYHHDVDSRGRLHRVDWMVLVAEPHNLEIIKYVHGFCRDEIIRLAEKDYPLVGFGNKSSWKKDFCYGAVQGVGNQLAKQWKESQSQGVSSTALVHVKDTDLQNALMDLGIRPRPMSLRPTEFGVVGYIQGRERGENMQINRAVPEQRSVGGYLE